MSSDGNTMVSIRLELLEWALEFAHTLNFCVNIECDRLATRKVYQKTGKFAETLSPYCDDHAPEDAEIDDDADKIRELCGVLRCGHEMRAHKEGLR